MESQQTASAPTATSTPTHTEQAPEGTTILDHSKLSQAEYNQLVIRNSRNAYFREYLKRIRTGQHVRKKCQRNVHNRVLCECGMSISDRNMKKHLEGQVHRTGIALKRGEVQIVI